MPSDVGVSRLANPASLEPLGEIEVANAADVAARSSARARRSPSGRARPSASAQRLLERALRMLVERQDEFLDVIVAETGKPREEAQATEILAACDALQFYAKRAGRILADRTLPLHLMKTKKLRISYRPLGVVGIITPWNFPFLLALNPTVQALMAGNAVLLKPSEVTPFSGQLVEQLLRGAGLPGGRVPAPARRRRDRARRWSTRASTRSRSPAACRPAGAWPRPARAS